MADVVEIYTCDDQFSEDLSGGGKSDVAVQTPKRKMMVDVAPFDAPARKVIRRGFYFSPGRDIRRNLFTDTDPEKIRSLGDRAWAILKVDSIRTSADHECIRRFYLGDSDGRHFVELEFYPCTPYRHLAEEYQELFEDEKKREHGLTYNPVKRTMPCKCAVSKINDFIISTGVDVMLYSSLGCSQSVESNICKYLDFPSLDIYEH